jgi:hypothetical protein
VGARSQTHCKHGHAFTPDNTYTDRGWRRCRACTLAGNKLWDVYKRKGDTKRSLLRRAGFSRNPVTGVRT